MYVVTRFIPACAGNTSRRAKVALPAPVHPRLRGEHGAPGASATQRAGSSPPARGTLGNFNANIFVCRFIPACAGNTGETLLLIETFAVHPRLRGEHVISMTYAPAIGGSSPPARGTLPVRSLLPLHLRFIPACAGNT